MVRQHLRMVEGRAPEGVKRLSMGVLQQEGSVLQAPDSRWQMDFEGCGSGDGWLQDWDWVQRVGFWVGFVGIGVAGAAKAWEKGGSAPAPSQDCAELPRD
jgi:hypothetical protein